MLKIDLTSQIQSWTKLPNATKLFLNQRLWVKKTPSPSSKLLPTNAQGSGFLLKTQQHCFQGEGGGKNRSTTKFRKNAPKYSDLLYKMKYSLWVLALLEACDVTNNERHLDRPSWVDFTQN